MAGLSSPMGTSNLSGMETLPQVFAEKHWRWSLQGCFSVKNADYPGGRCLGGL